MGGTFSAVDNMLGTDISGTRAMGNAVGAQTNATNQANKFLSDTYTTQQNYLNPYNAVGKNALNQLAGGNIMDGYKASDAYKFQLEQGQNAINNSMAAKGLGNSSAAMQNLAKYSQGLASQDAQQYYNNEYNRLSGLAGLGFNSANQLSANTGSYGANVSNNFTGLGNAIASANMAQHNSNNALLGQGMGAGAMALAASDKRVKQNVEELTPQERNQVGEILKAYKFNYLSDEFGSGDWIGVMAQDLEKHPIGKILVVENEQGIKMIDLKKVLSMFLAYSFSEAA